MLLTECEWAGAEVRLKTSVKTISGVDHGYQLQTSSGTLTCESLVIACGGLSIPTMGATGFGYDIAKQFGLAVLPTRAGLVPFTLHPELKEQLAPLSGVSCPVDVHCNNEHFREPMLVTHRGLSGPSMLQISSFWHRTGPARPTEIKTAIHGGPVPCATPAQTLRPGPERRSRLGRPTAGL